MKVNVRKMALYICDFENYLSVKDIQDSINNYVLGGISDSGFCHVSPLCEKEIDWEDDHPLNFIDLNCQDEIWESVLGKEKEEI